MVLLSGNFIVNIDVVIRCGGYGSNIIVIIVGVVIAVLFGSTV